MNDTAFIVKLWDKYNLPQPKRLHMTLVSRVASVFAVALLKKGIRIKKDTLLRAAMLHDIDKCMPPKPGERHPDVAVRIVREEGMAEEAKLISKHPLHAILNPRLRPESWEEKILYLSDKMVKNEIITVDRRFAQWRAEQLPEEAVKQLDEAYPYVKILESEIFKITGLDAEKVAGLAKTRYT